MQLPAAVFFMGIVFGIILPLLDMLSDGYLFYNTMNFKGDSMAMTACRSCYNNKGKSDQKNQYTYVDFRTLSGNELLKAVTDRECCTFCWKKHDKSAACEGKDHVCKRCDRKGHLDKCCAYPKKKQD